MIHFLTSAGDDPPASPARAAIVGVVMGEKHTKAWFTLCAASWRDYAERCGFDILIVTERLDPSDAQRSPAWQKLLILDQRWSQRYERIIWLDSDILISSRAPDILDHAGPPEKVSLGYDGGHISAVEGQIYLERALNEKLRPDEFAATWPKTQGLRQAYEGGAAHEAMCNTGVMALSPHHHNALLLEVYQRPQLTNLYEQPYLSHRLIEAGLVHVLSPRFNWGVAEAIELCVAGGDGDAEFLGQAMHVLLCAELRKAYFLHFYGTMNLLMHYAGFASLQGEVAAAA